MIDKHGNGFRDGKPRGKKKSHKSRCGVCACYFWVFSISIVLQAISFNSFIHSFIMHHHLSAFSSGRSGISDRIEIKSFCSCGRVVHATATSEDLEFRIDPFVRPPRSRSNRSFLSVLHYHPRNFCHSGYHCGLTH